MNWLKENAYVAQWIAAVAAALTLLLKLRNPGPILATFKKLRINKLRIKRAFLWLVFVGGFVLAVLEAMIPWNSLSERIFGGITAAVLFVVMFLLPHTDI